MSKTVTAAEAARSFSDLLDRVHDRGETFLIERNGQQVAQLGAVSPQRASISVSELVSRLSPFVTGDPQFARDLEDIQTHQPELEDDPWRR